MRICVCARNRYRYETAGQRRDPDVAPDAAQPRWPVCRRLADRQSPPTAGWSSHEDAFGNITHAFSASGRSRDCACQVEGEVETQDTNGVVRGAVERFPPSLFLRETALTDADADDCTTSPRNSRDPPGSDARLAACACWTACTRTSPSTPTRPEHRDSAAEAFALKRGVCQDFATSSSRLRAHAAVPARYVGGYFRRADGAAQQEAGHAWAEAFVPDLGWVGFDPANGYLPDRQPCARRRRARLPRRRTGARHALWRRRGEPSVAVKLAGRRRPA